MYASNEVEDWVYLHETPPTNRILREDFNRVGDQCSSSSSSNSSSKFDRSISLSSISSAELEHTRDDDTRSNIDSFSSSTSTSNDDYHSEQKIHSLEISTVENPLVFHSNYNMQFVNENRTLITTKEKDLPLEINLSYDHDKPTNELVTNISGVIDENDIFNTGFELNKTILMTSSSSFSHEPLSVPNDFRSHHLNPNLQDKDLFNSEIIQSMPIYQDIQSEKYLKGHQNKTNPSISCLSILVVLIVPFILGQVVAQWNQSAMNKIAEELSKTNQRLSEIRGIPMGNIEQKVANHFEEKLQSTIYQQSAWHDHEKHIFNLQILELHELLKMTRENLTNTIYQLRNENRRLEERIKLLEYRLEVTEEQYSEGMKMCTDDVNDTKSSPLTLDKLVNSLFNKTNSIIANTSVKLSSIFQSLRVSLNNIVDYRHEYIRQNKRKLNDLAAEKLRTTLRHGIESLSSLFREVKLTYVTWLRTVAQRQVQTRMKNNEHKRQQKQGPRKRLQRWTCQYDYTPKRPHCSASNNERVYQSKFPFPTNKLLSMTNWIMKVFRP